MIQTPKKLTCPPQKWFRILIVTVLAAGLSCAPTADPLLDMLDSHLSNAKIDSLSRTMNFVVSPIRFDKTQFEEKLSASLNRWAKAESDLMKSGDWTLDPMAEPLIEKYALLPVVKEVKNLSFAGTDSYYLQQNFWAKKLAERLIASMDSGPFEVFIGAADLESGDAVDENVDPLVTALQKNHQNLSASDAELLANSVKVFDWVIRNIHLLADNELTKDLDDIDDIRLNDSESPCAAGIPGLGYTRFPWQTMLFSRGDYVERAKLFMVMLDQLEIDSVMLEIEDEENESKPWAIAVHVGGKFYLFDTKLGLPIPGEKPGTIATFTDVKSNSEILKSLDLSVNESLKDETKYWVKSEQLNNVKALMFGPPEALSYRFWELENKLVGESRMKLALNPTETVQRLPKIDGLEYGIWDIDFKTHLFRRTLRDAIAESSFKDDVRDKIRWYLADEVYVNEFVRYRTARSKYFNGIYETIRNDGNLNAIELFYSMIYKDSKIESLATDRMFQLQLQVARGKQSSEEFLNSLAGIQSNMRLVRRDSGYFLSQCHFDNSNYSTTANWLTRLEQIEDTSRWQAAINYLRARSLEAQRDYDSAIEILEKQESEQFHGDLIRARQLKSLAAKATSPVNIESNTDQPESPDSESKSDSD